MKRLGIILTIVLIAGASAFVATRCFKPVQAGKNLEAAIKAENLSAKLALSQKQKEQVAGLQAVYLSRLIELDNKHCGACCKVGGIIFNQDKGDESIRIYLDEMANAQKESEIATIKYIQQIHAMLEPEQKKIFEDMVKDCICRCGPASGCKGECGKK